MLYYITSRTCSGQPVFKCRLIGIELRCDVASEPKSCRLKSESSCKKVKKKYIRGSVEALDESMEIYFSRGVDA